MRDLPYVVVTLEWAKDELEYEWNLGFWQRLPGDECVGKLWALAKFLNEGAAGLIQYAVIPLLIPERQTDPDATTGQQR